MLEGDVSRLSCISKRIILVLMFVMNTASICELLCLIFPSPYKPTSYVRSYISFADPDFAALLPKVGTTGCMKVMFCIRLTDCSLY
jgi:hypothetical protein